VQPKSFSVQYLSAAIGIPAAVPGTGSWIPQRLDALDCNVLLSLNGKQQGLKHRKRKRRENVNQL